MLGLIQGSFSEHHADKTKTPQRIKAAGVFVLSVTILIKPDFTVKTVFIGVTKTVKQQEYSNFPHSFGAKKRHSKATVSVKTCEVLIILLLSHFAYCLAKSLRALLNTELRERKLPVCFAKQPNTKKAAKYMHSGEYFPITRAIFDSRKTRC